MLTLVSMAMGGDCTLRWFFVISQFPLLIHVNTFFPREPQERMESLVSEETKEILASRVPGASR